MSTVPQGVLAVPRHPVMISGMKLGLGAVRTHLFLLCRLLLQDGVAVELYANGSQWSAGLIEELRRLGAQLHLPPRPFWSSPRMGMLYAVFCWPLRIPRQAASLYCIGGGRSHLWLDRLKPRRALSINHEIVDAPAPGSVPGRCASLLDVTVANSRKVAQRMKRDWPNKPMRVIPFLTAEGAMPPQGRNRPPGQGGLKVSYLGRLVRHKRPDQLVRCWKELSGAAELHLASLDVYGYDPAGEMLEELRRFVAESGMADRVRIHGNYEPESLPGILAETDLVVLPSLQEGLPLVLVEAMLHGVPFVATDAGGTEELAQGNPDALVTGNEWGAFVGGVLEMARKIRAGQVDALRLRRWAEQRYGYAAVSRQWLACLNKPREFFGRYD